ncbi:sigma-70 family RNA polymerase sigma factor [Shewanella psychropiezotolerans]|uniref:Sigma-70 family RNA polymerase sigma factor n=1 Tax=Shewanella psychropiezotolerans TaxID=2593655 RepID=A0ABX5X351_9GAMM|nr:sigma-70 family RNA polymerase sigma factor [Shewanella psychropiezotolerans]QDO85636.1 sigma-70 family RNA polymerase sigma factor [Shewanella psychropiezotolerans]
MSETDEILLARTAMGDKEAFQRLYFSLSPRIFPVLMQLIHDYQLTEDLLQETFVRIWNQASRYDINKSGAYTWSYTIARHLALDHLRRLSLRRTQKLTELEIELELEVGETLLSQHSKRKLDTCLSQLKSDQRQAFILSYCYGYEQRELVRILEHPLGTIKSWLRRGMEFMQKCVSR